MKRPQTIINLLYKSSSKVTIQRFNDEAWEGVNQLVSSFKTVLESLNLIENRKLNMWLNCEEGGYKSNRDGQIWKEYLLHIEDDGKEIIGGVITCSPCGTVADIWKLYDLTVQMWKDVD